MKSLIKRFIKPSKEAADPFVKSRISLKPIAPWKRNIFAVFSGSAIGLYIGQYFPDVFYHKAEPYLPEIEQLKDLSPQMEDKKPSPVHPKSLFDFPKNALEPERSG